MDFPQQVEETYVEFLNPSSPPYDAIMESPLYAKGKANPSDKMNTSVNSSTLEDTTPSDSGVQMMDSESSELMIESITSQTGFDFEETPKQSEQQAPQPVAKENVALGQPVDNNSNVTGTGEELMETSTCSTFDTTENIVYRRKVRKTAAAPKAPKKRVSFHEDILKNTRTDNIHIEHGFITYKNGRKVNAHHHGVTAAAGRYSWCSEGDRAEGPMELCANGDDDEGVGAAVGGASGGGRRCVVYRNACSDVLDYGNSDVYDTNEDNGLLQYDNSGVFEYVPEKRTNGPGGAGTEDELYRCSCSSSNSSLDSDENSDKNSNRSQYGQAKSSSCDCIGMSNANNNLIGDNCYYSEPNIDNMHKKSVWNKEKKPKTSCLKKTKRHTNIIHEQDLSTKVKKFNVHDMNQLIDNSSKMIIGSLKSIFTMPITERGLPEGSEDLQSVIECVAELEPTPEHKPAKVVARAESPPLKAKPFLSKSLDGSRQQQAGKQFVHNVDEQLRRKNDEQSDMDATNASVTGKVEDTLAEHQRTPLQRQEEVDGDAVENALKDSVQQLSEERVFRNKFIINCESTVFEHTGVSYCYESSEPFNAMSQEPEARGSIASLIEHDTPVAQPEPDQLRNAFIGAPLAKTFSNFFRSFTETATTPIANKSTNTTAANKLENSTNINTGASRTSTTNKKKNLPNTPSSSTISDLASPTTSSMASPLPVTTASQQSQQPQPQQMQKTSTPLSSSYTNSLAIGSEIRSNLDKQSRHLPSPLKKRTSCGTLMQPQQQRYGSSGNTPLNSDYNSLLSPDLFNGSISRAQGSGRDSKSTILSEEFDDILTITTDTDRNESDIVMVDYPELSDRQSMADYANLLKPPQPPSAKTSLINRFLRNVTQKKLLETSIRKNNFFNGKLKNEQKLFTGNLYVRGVKPKNYELIDDLNAEIAMEIEMSANSPRRELVSISDAEMTGDVTRYELGIGEISIDIFNGNHSQILRDPSEQLMKVFKLYTGYSRDGFMTPVLVFLTDKTLYVTDLVRNRLYTKFVLPYADLDVILMGPYGNTVLLSNSERDMQQVLLAGYPADGLVANLELCARRNGASLPAVGQLTLHHLSPLQAFVSSNSSVGKEDRWMYYAVVNVPAGTLGSEKEPLGPHVKGFLMHRRVNEHGVNSGQQGWNPGYFLLKAGVLYMFNDSSQKLPSWAMALAECQGARRAFKTGRPHCFEILLKGQLLQLAAPDEYVASEWLQALLQSASGLFEMQEKHKTLGCSLVVTQNHLITLREDFTAPLRQLNKKTDAAKATATDTNNTQLDQEEECSLAPDPSSVLSSAVSTPTKGTQRSSSSLNSTPTKLSQWSRSSLTGHSLSTSLNNSRHATTLALAAQTTAPKESYSNMSSVYGKNSGVEVLTCADIKDMTGIKIPSHNDTWWCVLEFSCQEVRECPDDLVIFFASSSEMQRFLRLLEQLWQAKNNDLFPITVLDEDDLIAEQCTMLYIDINRSWEPLISAALGYPL